MGRRKAKRYDTESKLNIKKVIAVILAIAVIIMFVVGINSLLKENTDKKTTIISSYFPVYTNEKWGVIDQKGEIVIEAQYDEMITIPDSKTDIFIITYDVDYTNGTYKTKVLNSKNEEIFTNYDLVEAIENIDSNNSLWFEDGVLKVKKDGLYGLIDYSGNEILKTEYTSIEALQGVENSLIITKDDQVGLCDNKGNIIISPEYKEIQAIGEDYKNGYIVINSDNKYGIIDFTKKTVLETEYDEIKPVTSNNMYVVKQEGTLKLINSNKEVLIESGFDDIAQINSNNVVFIKNNKYGVMSINGEVEIKAQYEKLEYIFDNYYIAKKSGKYGIINIDADTCMDFSYTSLTYIEEAGLIEAEKEDSVNTEIYDNKLEKKLEGIISTLNTTKCYIRIRIDDEYKYYNFKFEEIKAEDVLTQNNLFLSKKDGKYGYVDSTGNIVIDYIYDDGTEQNSFGYVAVKKDGYWTAIDKDGNVQQANYELNNNLVIDFIGNWHLAQDLNSYYYTDNK